MKPIIDIESRELGARCCLNEPLPQMDTVAAEQLSSDLHMLAHPVRLQILTMLAHHEGQVCVCDLEAALPVKQPTVSHHLKLLRKAGLIDFERRGQWAYYFLNRATLAEIRSRFTTQLDWLT